MNMDNLVICIGATLPIFLLMCVGYAAKRFGIIQESSIPAMNTVAFKVFLPVLSFYNIYNSDLSYSLRPRLMVFTIVMILIVFVMCVLFSQLFIKERRNRGVVIQGLFRSNYLIIGLSVATMLLPHEDTGVICVLTIAVVPIFNILAVAVLDWYSGEKARLGQLFLDFLKNPLIIACSLGIVFLLLKLKLPLPLDTTLRDIGRVGSPLTLFLLGAFFRVDKVRMYARDLCVVLLGRLIIIPAVALTAAALLGFRGIEFVTILALFGSATAAASFTMVQQIGGDASLAGNIVVFTSVACSLTLFLWSLLFKTLGMF